MKKLGRNAKFLLLILAVFMTVFMLSGIVLSTSALSENGQENETSLMANEGEEKSDTYLSDLSNSYLVSGYLPNGVVKDKTSSGGFLSIKMDGYSTYFLKGLFTPTEKRFIYNISDLDYRYFSSFIGVQSNTSASGKAVFGIDLSNSATGGWVTKYSSEDMTSNDSAKSILIDLQGYSYMRVRADFASGSRIVANAVWADAKFTDNANQEFHYLIKSLNQYDQLLKNEYADADLSNKEYELALLQRNYISKFGTMGHVTLHNYILSSENNAAAFNWLFNNLDVLRMYTTGGMPDNVDMYKKNNTYNASSWSNSLRVLTNLYTNFKDDLADDSLSELGKRRGDIYQKMMIAISLTHSKRVRFWIYDLGADNSFNKTDNDSNPLMRYQVFKKMWLAGKLDNNVFENIEVEEMRNVMNTLLPDNEIEWLLDYWKWKGTKGPYNHMAYLVAYEFWSGVPHLYDPEKKDYYYEKYRLDGYGIEYKKYYTHAWMMFETGGVCWNMSNIGANMTSVWGHPSTPLGQSGYVEHVAYADYYKNAEGKGYWALTNDVFGWVNTNFKNFNNLGSAGGWYTLRPMLDWGVGSYASVQSGTYLLLAQAAMNDFANFEKAKELMLLANVYNGDLVKQEQIYRQALEIQKFNLDAWLGIINNYAAQQKTGDEFVELARQLADALKFYPLPMYDMLRLIGKHASKPEHIAVLSMIQAEYLAIGSKATEAQVLQSNITRIMANYLLGRVDTEVAKFDFDGEGGGTLALGKMYETSKPTWEYSLDGGKTWLLTDEKSLALTTEQIQIISADTDIKVHIIGTNRTEENTYVIDITKANDPTGFYVNDWENKIFGLDETMDWRYQGEEDWTAYSKQQPDLSGDKTIEIRRRAAGTKLASEVATYSLTSDGENNTQKKYIPIKHLSVYDVSSEATTHQGDAAYMIDGNYNTRWHSDWNGNDTKRYIIIEFDQLFAFTAMDYIPAGGGNGKILKGKIYGSVTGEEWTELASVDWQQNETLKTAEFLDSNLKFKYIKIVGEKCSGSKSFISGRMFNFYHNEEATLSQKPTAALKYSTKALTNGDVIVDLYNSSANIIVTNNGGKTSHTFTENGTFTFEFKDVNGQTGQAVASVDWIDKDVPVAEASYSTTDKTKNNVIVTLTFNEDVVINNNGGRNTYTFTTNGEFTFFFTDLAGNQGSYTAKVENIFNTRPNIIKIEYSTTEPTKDNVTVTFTLDREVKEYSTTTYSKTFVGEFTENKSKIFLFTDELGNRVSKQINVNWIDRTTPKGTIIYSTRNYANKVTAYVEFDEENVVITNNDGKNSYLFENNGSFTFEFVDRAGNTGSATANVSWIDKNIVAPEIVYDINDFTNKNVKASLLVDGKVVGTHIFEENGKFDFSYQHNGNTIVATAVVTWIDKKAPVGTISYSTMGWTRFGVTALITFDENDVVITNNGGLNTYVFDERGTFTFEFIDKAGNVGSATAKVTWIYKSVPKAIISYNLTSLTNKDVIASVVDFEKPDDVEESSFNAFKKSIIVNNNFGSRNHTFIENGSFTFQFVDGAGNEASAVATVDWIDKVVPTAKLDYSNYDITRDPVTVVISFDKENVTILNNDGKDSYTFDDNGTFIFEFEDQLGNRGQAQAIVNWINKKLPNVSIVYDIVEKTNQDVVATLVFDSEDEVVIVNNDGNNHYTFTENGSFTFEYVYGEGNFASITAEVSWIKKTISIKYYEGEELLNEDVISYGSGYQILFKAKEYDDKVFSHWASGEDKYYEGDILSLEDDLTLVAVYKTNGENPGNPGENPGGNPENPDVDPDDKPKPDENKDGNSNMGLIIGIAAAAVAVCAITAVTIILLKKKKHK